MNCKRILIIAIVTMVATGALADSAQADPFGYGIATDRNLYAVDLGAATATVIGSLGPNAGLMESIALSQSGDLYTADTSGNLYSINASTGFATLIGSTGLGNIEGLDFSNGTLIAANFSSTPSFYSLNVSDASATLISTSNLSTGVPRGLAMASSTTGYFAGDAGNERSLYRLDLASGNTTLIGALTGLPSQSPLGLDFGADGQLYGLNSDGAVITISTTDASYSLVGDTGNQYWLGLTANPVPEPGTIALLGFGVLGLAYGHRRRKSRA